MTPNLLLLVPAATVGLLVFLWFVRLERQDRPEVVFGVLLGVLLVDVLVYKTQQEVPAGLARIDLAGGSFRPPEVLLPIAVAARLIVRGGPRRLTATTVLWSAFLLWYGTGAVMGILAENPRSEILYQAKALITVGGAAFLVAGLRPNRLLDPQLIARWVMAVGVAAVVLFATSVVGLSAHIGLPMLSIPQLGDLGPDARYVVPTFAAIVLLVEICRPDRRAWVCGLSLAMLPMPLAGTQAAPYVGVGAFLGVIAVAALGRTWGRRVFVTAAEALLLLTFLGGGFFVATVIQKEPPVDVTAQLEESFFSNSSARTADARVVLWRDALDQIEKKPVMGSGLGVRQTLHQLWDLTQQTETTPHNIALELAVRTGIVGLALFAAAYAASAVEALRTWREHDDRLVAALSLGALAGMSVFLAVAFVQPALDHYRNAAMLGILVGLVVCCARSREGRSDPSERPELYVVGPDGQRRRTRERLASIARP